MTNPKMRALPPSPREHMQDESSQLVLSSPSTSADPSKMSEVNRPLSTPESSHASMGLNEPCGSKKLDIPNQEGQHAQLCTSLKALVTKVVSQLRRSILDEVLDPDPISYILPKDNDEANVSTNKENPSSSVEVKTRAKTILVGEETVSFVLSPECLIGTDLDKEIQHRSLFQDRLRGWNIACRRRANGKLDMNYRHGQSRRMFRSTVEVVGFIMEAWNKETPGNSSLQEQSPAAAIKGLLKRKRPSNKKEKDPASKSSKISSEEKITVERFLLESYNNLMNIYGGKWMARESEEWPRSENRDDASSDEETL